MHEETQEVVRTGFETTTSVLNDIQYRILQLEESIRTHHVSQVSLEEEVLQFAEDVALDDTQFTGQTLAMNKVISEDTDIASECIDFASFLHDKVSSRTGSVADSSNQSRASRSVRRLDTQVTSPEDRPYSPADTTTTIAVKYESSIHQPYARPHKRPVVEDEDVLTDHVDNNCRLALNAIKDKNFEDAETCMKDAISTAEQREKTYNFPFEDRSEFLEILAFILTQKNQFRAAEEQYYALLKQAQALPGHPGSECKLSYALARLYRAENRLHPRQDKDDPLLVAWCDHAIHAFNLAKSLEISTVPQERIEPEAIWKHHPSLKQAAQMVFEMYTCRGMSAHADTYRQRHLNQPESFSHSRPILARSLQPHLLPHMMPPPSPPESEGIMHPTHSRTRGSDVSEWSTPTISSRVGAPGIQEHINNSQYEIVNWILHLPDQFIDIEQCNDKGQTLLLLAVTKRDAKIVRLLLDYHNKPNVKAKDKSGRSVLHYALRGQGGEDMVELLVKHGADVNASTPEGEGTPLHFAITNNKPRAVQILAANNADLEAKDGAGRTPMALAVRYKRDDLVQSLINAGATFDRSIFTDVGAKQFIKQLEASKIIPVVHSAADDGASRRDSISSKRSTSTISRIFGRTPRKPP